MVSISIKKKTSLFYCWWFETNEKSIVTFQIIASQLFQREYMFQTLVIWSGYTKNSDLQK